MEAAARKMSTRHAWDAATPVPIQALVHDVEAPLTIDGSCIMDNRERYEHCIAALNAGYPVLKGTNNRVFSAPCVLVGSGPSVKDHLEDIRERYERGEEIIAIKGAHDWLIENGIVPRAAFALDPQQSRAKCFKKLHKQVLYLCASQMHPDTWEHMRGYQVLVWHSRIEAGQEKLPGWDTQLIVQNCSTSGNSALLLMHWLGRRRFEVYGFDSSIPVPRGPIGRLMARLRGRLMKIDGARVPPEKRIFEVTVGDQRFQTTAELVSQVVEIHPLLKMLGRLRLTAHGEGYFQAVIAAGKANGWPI